MALFTDGSISSIEDLTALDSQLLTVASLEGIDVTQKLALAQNELALELNTMLERFRFLDWPSWLVSEPQLDNIVVTPGLQLWHSYRSLELFYSDAYGNELNDRYGAKRDQFRQMAGWAKTKIEQGGLGVVINPIPQAATPTVTPLPGALPDGTYYVTMAWVNGSGQEGASAEPAVMTLASSSFIVQPGPPPQAVVGWNVYAGNSPDGMVLQNGVPLAASQIWRQLTALATAGRAPGPGQQPAYLKPMPRILQRG